MTPQIEKMIVHNQEMGSVIQNLHKTLKVLSQQMTSMQTNYDARI
jgi:hypothetical protein